MGSQHDHRAEPSTQARRFAAALAPDSIRLDERETDTLIAFAREFARLLTFYDENNNPRANWSAFLNDVSVILAEISTLDIRRKHFKALALEWDVNQEHDLTYKNERAAHLLAPSTALFDKFFKVWLEQIQHISKHQGIELEVETTLSSLQKAIEPLYIDIKKSIKREKKEETVAKDIDDALTDYRTFISYARAFVTQAQVSLEDSLQEKWDHHPHVALYLVFALLFKAAQAHLNTLTERHLDYYYRRILRLQQQPSVPDTVHVCFKPAEHIDEYEIKAGTLLHAGTDEEGRELLYRTLEDIVVNQATIAEKKTLFVQQKPLPNALHFVEASLRDWAVEGYTVFKPAIPAPAALARPVTITHSPYEAPPITQLFVAPIADSADGLGTPLDIEEIDKIPDWALRKNPERGWPTFGKTTYYFDAEKNEALRARIGLVLASPVLLLREGERRIQLTLAFDKIKRHSPLRAYLHRLATDYDDEITDWSLWVEDLSPMLSETFLVYLSGEDGWIPVKNYDLILDPDQNTIVLDFALAPTDPAVVANQPDVLGEAFETAWPLLKVLLNPDAPLYPYSFLKDLSLDPRRSSIRVEVKGMTTLFLQNEGGALDATKPFQPFGAVPIQGSYLLFGNKELSQKKLDALSVTIDWHNLPRAPHHFGTYYAAYNRGIKNESFQTTISARIEQMWTRLQTFPLFCQVSGDDKTLTSRTCLTLDLSEELLLRPDYQVEEPLVFDPQTPSGFFRLELSNPPDAFGQELYPRLFADAALENAMQTYEMVAGSQKKRGGTQGKATTLTSAMPNPPFVPVAKAFSVDYVATRPLTLADQDADNHQTCDQFFYILPFGQRARYTTDTGLIPRYDGQGYLYLGLADIKPLQVLTLFFQLHVSVTRPRCANTDGSKEAFWEGVHWEYLSDDQWRRFPKRTLIADTTRGFTRSGIIKLEMHSYITDNNTILPAGLHWIRAIVSRDIEQRGNTLTVYTQAVPAQRVVNEADPPPNGILPPGSILGLVEQTAAIDEVMQPHSSHGYTPREHLQLYRTRVSERLRHKKRAVHSWDYERLALEAFPHIGQAKCITYNRNTHPDTVSIRPGEVCVVVVPENATALEPRVDEHTLMDIATYLQAYASPHVEQICVRNPVYEYVRIAATVQFVEGEETGLSLDRLQEAINRYLAPWQFDPKAEIDIGVGEVAERDLLTYIEKLPYVESITQFALMQRFKNQHEEYHRLTDTSLTVARVVIRPSLPWAVLVPAPWHVLDIYDEKHPPEDTDAKDEAPDLPPEPIKAGISNLEIGMDFIITSKADAAPYTEKGGYFEGKDKDKAETPAPDRADQEPEDDTPKPDNTHQIIFQEAVIKHPPLR